MSRMRAPGAAGFTLMEMLVTLVIFSVVTALIWQALATLSKIEARLSDARLFASQDALRSQWVRQALIGLMNGPRGDPFQFTGNELGLKAYTTMPPWPGSLGPEPIELLIEQDAATGESILVARRLFTGATWRLWEWEGPADFSYLGRDGRWSLQWPPPEAAQQPTLPRAVRLVAPEGRVLVVPVLSGENTLTRRRDIEAPE